MKLEIWAEYCDEDQSPRRGRIEIRLERGLVELYADNTFVCGLDFLSARNLAASLGTICKSLERGE